ncbi:DUF302 domain-containing protein [Ancylobacter defluvii]|uniref:DUF302 domain-containing protein n=1 Tax=Ancylobacter defluvii TaxID=1282440 RepID=A0A9W6NC93_9HYPH|nr:DUF302 domain-containing protein [Ancylobacter defluvii]MBS7586278.1 DUF302 domain-containing protein [Ancylobacter defluvii]GLK85558.1 hypothetical protein GCM10017653_36280 [Ancylobacter defluvii]
MASPEITSRPIIVEHVRITCARPFAEVRAALAAALPELDADVIALLSRGDRAAIDQYEAHGPKLFIFLERDHGALLAFAGGRKSAVQYEIGNPITASKMTRHHLGAALYAPLRVALFETVSGEVVFEYDRPSSLFGQFGDDEVRQFGLYLDRELEAVLLATAGGS